MTVAEAAKKGAFLGSEADVRHSEILDALYGRHPESNSILMELDDLFGALWCEALDEGARRQSRLIQATIEGDITVDGDGIVQGQVAL